MDENDQLLHQFLLEANDGNKASTATTERRVLSKFLTTVNKSAKEITKLDILSYIKSLDIEETTRDLYKIAIRKFFYWLYGYDSTDSSQRKPEVVAWIKVNRMKHYKYKTEADILTKAEIELLIQHCDSIQQIAMVSLLYDSAARIEEFTKLKIGDIVQKGDETAICVDGKTG